MFPGLQDFAVLTNQIGCYIMGAEMLLYGAYLVLFGSYMHMLCTGGARVRKHRNLFLTSATISLFLLSTIHLALILAITALDDRFTRVILTVGSGSVMENTIVDAEDHLVRVAFGIYVTGNVIADGIFIFRCYAIWGFNRKIVVVPILGTLCTAGFGYVNAVLESTIIPFSTMATGQYPLLRLIPISVSLGTTILLMFLTAGRIWWLARSVGTTVGQKKIRWYYTVCAMILESGSLYAAGALLVTLLPIFFYSKSLMSGAITGQLVGIAPTIIAVRVGLNKSIEGPDSIGNVEQSHPLDELSHRPIEFRVPTTHSIRSSISLQGGFENRNGRKTYQEDIVTVC
ncbi:hypothetical protein FB45DRAFT_936954 [Roridomyces roridus]|uniref:Uncharacterized protein n=1 Tax=Roridomyces roridus TaxID=1738132 RepID=A0AAD7FDV2_9AGAR|nr:hypothetical protein FB45DRAFT_936954 [Roridomyces roridus]